MRSSFWRCCGVVAEAPRPFSKTAPLRRFRDRYLARCGVRRECLDYALAEPDTVGIWGGSTGSERRAMRRDATMAPTGVEAIGR
jgi:hypothetical protein